MQGKRLYITASAATIALIAIWFALSGQSSLKQPATWQRVASPGALSAAHAHLESNCGACHTPVKGVEAANCIVCHANNESILQRQPTSFHGSISSCEECHLEHQGRATRPTNMHHAALVEIGLRQLKDDDGDGDSEALREHLVAWAYQRLSPHADITADEAILNCTTCHSNDDRHFQLFGRDCAQCHATDRWTIPEFQHPSPNSTDCAQCHQAPPSHYMMHFKMISARVAGKPHARVDQCFQCHQTTSWNDIRGAGWYKHH